MNGPNPIFSGMPGGIEFELKKEATSRQKDDRETREEELLFSKNLNSKYARLFSVYDRQSGNITVHQKCMI